MSRAGRKRKIGVRRDSRGRVILQPRAVNWLKQTANQPHRRLVAEELRTSADAGSALGRLYLLKTINEPQYLAGQDYARRRGAYHATIDGPRVMAGNGRWGGCNPIMCLGDGRLSCVCAERKIDYHELRDVVSKKGHRCTDALDNLIGNDANPSNLHELYAVCVALSAIAKHMHIKARG